MDNRVTGRRFRPVATLWILSLAISISPAPAQVVSILKNLSGEQVFDRAIDDSGSVVYAISSSNQYGTNPGYRKQIFRWDPATGLGSQLTSFVDGVNSESSNYYGDGGALSVSDDDQWLAFLSSGDLTGANHDGSAEVFVMHSDGTGLSQVTSDASYAGDGVITASISGSGNRIVFIADTDPLGTNPGRTPHVFVVDRDGTGVVQLGELHAIPFLAAISDDGERVVYVDNSADFVVPPDDLVFASPADGAAPPALIANSPFQRIWSLAFSGNGETVGFEDNLGISKVNYDGTGLRATLVPEGHSPSITDDGLTIFFTLCSPYFQCEIWKMGSDGIGATQVDSFPIPAQSPLVSGGGSRIAAYLPTMVGGYSQPADLMAFEAFGGNPEQLTVTTVPSGSIWSPQILANGTRVFFESFDDLVGGNPDRGGEIYTMLPGGTGLGQVTHLTEHFGLSPYSVSDAGVIVFESSGNHTGQNACHAPQIFRIPTSGTPLTQLSSGCDGTTFLYSSLAPKFRYDSQLIVFQGSQPVGTNADGHYELMKMTGTGTGVAPITDEDEDDYIDFSLSANPAPTWVAYSSIGNKDGLNPNHTLQISRITTNAGFYLRITADPAYDSFYPDISGDGNKIVWTSQADFVGQNADHSTEIFLYDVPSATKRQLTNTTGILAEDSVKITRDGAWVYFMLNDELLRTSVATGAFERVVGFRGASSELSEFDVDSSGTKTVFTGQNVIDRSPSSSPYSLFLTDLAKKPAFAVGKLSPTLLSWDPDPQSVRYDVIRGSVADLAVAGSTVDLGPVTCIEDDSPDNNTLGSEDAQQPDPGECFFYLYRGTVGVPPVTGSWGLGTGARERVAGAASCTP
jgi:Tol biopolymer transport system component